MKVKFKNLDEGEIERQVMIEFRKSQTVFNYLRAGVPVPDHLKDEWKMSFTKEEEKKILKDQQKKPNEGGDKDKGTKGKPAGIQYQERG